jgi:hypothetical protein
VVVGGALIVTVIVVPESAASVATIGAQPGAAIDGGALTLAVIALLGFELATVVSAAARPAGPAPSGAPGGGPSSEPCRSGIGRIPRRLAVQAGPVVALAAVGLFVAVGAWAFAGIAPAASQGGIPAPAEGGMGALIGLARAAWGEGDVLVVLTGPVAALGILVAAMAGAARVIGGMRDRDGAVSVVVGGGTAGSIPGDSVVDMPAIEAGGSSASTAEPNRTGPAGRLRTPAWLTRTRALTLTSLAGALVWPLWLPATLAGDDGTLATVAWWASAAAVFLFTVYLAVNAAGLLGFRGRRRTVGAVAGHIVVPIAGLILTVALFLTLLAVLLAMPDPRMGAGVVIFCLAVLVVDGLAALLASAWRPRIAGWRRATGDQPADDQAAGDQPADEAPRAGDPPTD